MALSIISLIVSADFRCTAALQICSEPEGGVGRDTIGIAVIWVAYPGQIISENFRH
jgi:hypothetical protein